MYQLRDLFLAAVPTVILVFLFYLFLRANFFRPLERVLTERGSLTEGARDAARRAESAAQEKWKEYQDALKRAHGEIYAEQEAVRRGALDERAALIRGARQQGNERIRLAKERIGSEFAAAQKQFEAESESLAGEIVRTILERPLAPAQVVREA